MNRILRLLFFVCGCCVSAAHAVTFNVPTLSQDDFEAAVYAAHDGDVIILPAGSAVWGNTNRLNQGITYITSNVTIIGQGDATVITLDDTGRTYANGVIALWSAS